VTRPSLFDLAGIEGIAESYWADIADRDATQRIVEQAKPDIIMHLAAQALVRPSYRDPGETFATNVMGTVNILEAVRKSSSVRAVVAVTTDKVYSNSDQGIAFRETDALGGRDPYSASKSAAEMIITSYRASFFAPQGIGLASARAGNVIGGGDWAEDRILPDAVRAWSSGQSLDVRKPEATRPWQHVLEPIAGYLRLAQVIFENPASATDYNFGPDPEEAATVRSVVTQARSAFGRGETNWGSHTDGLHEASTLTLDNTKARTDLGIRPLWNLETAICQTMIWYRDQLEGSSAIELCECDIKSYLSEG
jgi:CDP-glucose 4,6-dehydratase